MKKSELIVLLNEKAEQYNRTDFIETDPIQIPHRFSKKEDIEIAGFLTSVIAWGQRKTIINNALKLMELMDNAPHDFILNFKEKDLARFQGFVHRTFNYDDLLAFLNALQRIYRSEGGLENAIAESFKVDLQNPGTGWNTFKTNFFSGPHLVRSKKHLPDPLKGSAAKRMNMYLRWMIRSDEKGVDFGIWKTMSPAQLYLPLDVHTSRVARKLKLLSRKQDDWKAVVELTEKLRKLDPEDPVKYDFALFGLGAFEKY
ncbi:TIGR02757 family protein [Cryomorpha ignava]|uniref:TIGR02757 family protein n=1 Tax=Cryomorpha ignava TaxID=101383 RepID=A0A7K3WQJ3_9FLAO|nr:TIGR02757 family protein [Cryomorpha ignava]NEN23152.1 TIGR02757 family protein [Cryomorpha ignava]